MPTLMKAYVNRKVSGVATTRPGKRHRILVHILDEGNVLSWDFVLLQGPPHDISRFEKDMLPFINHC